MFLVSLLLSIGADLLSSLWESSLARRSSLSEQGLHRRSGTWDGPPPSSSTGPAAASGPSLCVNGKTAAKRATTVKAIIALLFIFLSPSLGQRAGLYMKKNNTEFKRQIPLAQRSITKHTPPHYTMKLTCLKRAMHVLLFALPARKSQFSGGKRQSHWSMDRSPEASINISLLYQKQPPDVK